jgi:hypothetical protein
VAVSQAIAAKDGDDGGIKFFAMQEPIAEGGNTVAKTYLAIRDEIFSAAEDKIAKVKGVVSGAPKATPPMTQDGKAVVQNKNVDSTSKQEAT